MSITSRPTNMASGAAHTGALQATTQAHATGNHGVQNPNHHPAKNNSTLMSLFNSRFSVPRQMNVEARCAHDDAGILIRLSFTGTIGQGTFGQIEKATLTIPTNSTTEGSEQTGNKSKSDCLQVAVKRVLQDPRYKNRELSIMQRLKNHPNIVQFFYYYYTTASSNSRVHRGASNRSGSTSSGVDLFLHLVLECFPESLCELIYRYVQRNVKISVPVVKVFTYQMLKALAYLHSHDICHRDIKSSNLLVDESSLVLKVCDFGSAKEMVPGAANVSYISSRYYRAPELLFGAQFYTCRIDIWSSGCVLAEMLRQHSLFMGADSVDQLVKVIRVLGTPTQQDVESMNSMYRSYNFPDVQPCPIRLFFPQHTPQDLLTLLKHMLVYNPTQRILPSDALLDPCFDELRALRSTGRLPNGVALPSHLFDSELGTACRSPALDANSRHWSPSFGSVATGGPNPTDRKSSSKQSSVTSNRDVVGDGGSRKGRPSTGSQNSDRSVDFPDAHHHTSQNVVNNAGGVRSGLDSSQANSGRCFGDVADASDNGRSTIGYPNTESSTILNHSDSPTDINQQQPDVVVQHTAPESAHSSVTS